MFALREVSSIKPLWVYVGRIGHDDSAKETKLNLKGVRSSCVGGRLFSMVCSVLVAKRLDLFCWSGLRQIQPVF